MRAQVWLKRVSSSYRCHLVSIRRFQYTTVHYVDSIPHTYPNDICLDRVVFENLTVWTAPCRLWLPHYYFFPSFKRPHFICYFIYTYACAYVFSFYYFEFHLTWFEYYWIHWYFFSLNIYKYIACVCVCIHCVYFVLLSEAYVQPYTGSSAVVNCLPNETLCAITNVCLPPESRCNGLIECLDETDELACPNKLRLVVSESKCARPRKRVVTGVVSYTSRDGFRLIR